MSVYKELLNDKNFSGIIVVLDNKSNIIDANDVFLGLLGFSLQEILNKNITELIVPEEKTLFLDVTYNQGVSSNMTVKFYHKSGAFRFFSFSILNFNKVKLLFGNTLKKDFLAKKYEYTSDKKTFIDTVFDNIYAEDIKDLFLIEDNPMSLILDLMPIEVWIKDKLGKYVYINEPYSLATGIKLKDCINKDDFQLFSRETAMSFVESDDLVKTTGKKITFSFENTDVNIDDKFATYAEVTKIPIYNVKRKFIGMIAFSVNTSHSKATEIMLQKERDKLMYVLDNIEAMVFEINSNYELLFVSGKLKQLLGIEMENKDIMDILLKSSKSLEAREKLRLALNGEKVLIESVIMGKEITFSLNPVKNNDGSFNIVGFGNVNINGGDINDK